MRDRHGVPITSQASRSEVSGVMSQDKAQRRLQSIDLLRGLAIVLMALDHTRDFFGASGANPRDIADPAVFLTRWVTHFCAPTFIFLAGASAYLYGRHKRSAGPLSRFLLTRGLWLVFIEFTLVRFGWNLNFDLKLFFAGVIWVIGASMIVLAGLVRLPERAIAAIALIMIAGHNLLDGIRAEHFGTLGWLWNFLHQPAQLHIGAESAFLVGYALVPWAGVMAMGYAVGPVFKLDPSARRHLLLSAGTALNAGFVLLRAANLYGDPAPWGAQSSSLATLLSFINCEKYPPSLLYLMMTLGPVLILLALFEHVHGRIADWLTTFGRVPFLFYVVHLPVIHALAVGLAWLTVGDAGFSLGWRSRRGWDYGTACAFGGHAPVLVGLCLHPRCRRRVQTRRGAWRHCLQGAVGYSRRDPHGGDL
jgi:uncharacterized membrane protein